jgi:hypothetical protein
MSKIDWIDKGYITGKIYQYTMIKSSDTQGNTDFGPWTEIEDNYIAKPK